MGKLLGKGLQDPSGKPLILQRGSGPQRDMMYMAAHHNKKMIPDTMEYIWSGKPAQLFRSPHWDKWFLLAKYLNHVPDGTPVCWLDADVLLVRPFEFPYGNNWNFAACRTESGQRWQIGVCFFIACEATRKLAQTIYVEGPAGAGSSRDDQQKFNKVPFGTRILPQKLDPTWNYWGQPYLPDWALPEVRIESWHGMDDQMAIGQMEAKIIELGGKPKRLKDSLGDQLRGNDNESIP